MFPSYLGRAECLNWNDTFGMTQYTIALRTPLPTSYLLPLPNVLLWLIRKDIFSKNFLQIWFILWGESHLTTGGLLLIP